MTDDLDPGDQSVVAFLLAAVVAAVAVGALLGYAFPVLTGIEEITVLEMVIPVDPGAFAVYGGVTVGVFLATLVLVLRFVSQFDDGTA